MEHQDFTDMHVSSYVNALRMFHSVQLNIQAQNGMFHSVELNIQAQNHDGWINTCTHQHRPEFGFACRMQSGSNRFEGFEQVVSE